MNPAIVVLNARRIPPVLDALERERTPKIWLTGYTEAELAGGVFAQAIRDTNYSHYLALSDDCEPLPGAVSGVIELLGRHPVATGWCCVDETSTMVNLTCAPLIGDTPLREAYSFVDRSEVVSPGNRRLLRTHFAGMSLTGMSRDMWTRFPFGVFAPDKGGWASDFHLSIRLRDAGIPIVANANGECVHHRLNWLTADPRHERLVGNVTPTVTIT